MLAEQFNWTPMQVDQQNAKIIKGLLKVLNVHNKIKNKEIEKMNKK